MNFRHTWNYIFKDILSGTRNNEPDNAIQVFMIKIIITTIMAMMMLLSMMMIMIRASKRYCGELQPSKESSDILSYTAWK